MNRINGGFGTITIVAKKRILSYYYACPAFARYLYVIQTSDSRVQTLDIGRNGQRLNEKHMK